jgi:hypothetical protein
MKSLILILALINILINLIGAQADPQAGWTELFLIDLKPYGILKAT